MIGGFPVGGSFSRSAVNENAGADTAWSGAITGVITLAALPVAGVLSDLPQAVVGGIIIGAGLEDELRDLVDQHHEVEKLVIHLDGVGRTDLTAAYLIRDLFEEAKQAGLTVQIANLAEPSRRVVGRVLEGAEGLEMSSQEDEIVEHEPSEDPDGQ